jgi:hypothetical protein
LVIASLSVSVGCQRQPPYRLAPVAGTVTQGGKPLAGVIVVFWPDGVGPSSSAPTDSSGRFQLHTDQGEEGAVVGAHRVCVIDGKALFNRVARGNAGAKGLPKELAAEPAAAVPPRYADKRETPLRVEVRGEEQVISLEVK